MLADEARHIPRQIATVRSRKVIGGAVACTLSVALLVLTSATPAKAIPPPPPCARGHRAVYGCVPLPGPRSRLADGDRRPRRPMVPPLPAVVQAPNGTVECHAFRIRPPMFGHFDSRITWRRHFTNQGPGLYLVRWHALPSGRIIGGPASFRVGSHRTGFPRPLGRS